MDRIDLWDDSKTAERLSLIEKEGYNAVGEFEVLLMIREIRRLQEEVIGLKKELYTLFS
jgi:hypothetical protein